VSNLPDAERVGKAINFLAETDIKWGMVCAHLSGLEHKGKVIKAIEYLKTSGTVGERTAIVDSSEAYKSWVEDIENATGDKETLRAQRGTAALLIELWRSVNSARSKGLIT